MFKKIKINLHDFTTFQQKNLTIGGDYILKMKKIGEKRAGIVVTILLLAVGFAAVSTTLIINGSAKVGENTDDFSVIFTAATLDGRDVYANVIDNTKKIITFETSDLKTLNQTSVLNYEVTNNSNNYDAEVQVGKRILKLKTNYIS